MVNPDPATEMSNTIIVLLAIGIVLFATLINFLGTKVLSQVAFWGFVAEIIATLVIGIWLLIQGREHDLGVLFQDLRPAELMNEQSFVAALAGVALTGIFLFYGFEACGDVAEEVKNPGVVVPRAMRNDHLRWRCCCGVYRARPDPLRPRLSGGYERHRNRSGW